MTEEESAVKTVFVDDRAAKRQLKRAKLVVVEGADKGKELMMEKPTITVGRSMICDLALDDKAVSGTHFEIVATEHGRILRDLKSTNGTYCGDLRVSEVFLKPGTRIRVGTTVLTFQGATGTVSIELSKDDQFHDLVGKSIRMREIFALLERVAATELTALIRGETGTGKELVARAIHSGSRRREEAFVVQDCSAIPKDLVESTLFGHERGAFTGATDRYKGSFEQANGGTIFLDEIGELDITLQPKLLRVLENREIRRVGGDRTLPVNVRVVAATNRDLRQMVNEGTFREDLYYRLSVAQVELPALRERPEDIPLLVRDFIKEFEQRHFDGDREFTVTAEAMSRLQGFSWPGNVRELKNTVERGVSLADTDELTVRDLTPLSQKSALPTVPGGTTAEQYVDSDVPFKEAKQAVIDAFESLYLKALLDKHGGNVTRSAQAGGLTRYHLRELAKRYGIRNET